MRLSEKSLQPSNEELFGFSGDKEGEIATVHADHKEARQCYNASLSPPTTKSKEEHCNAVYNVDYLPPLAELDPRTNTKDRPTPAEHLEKRKKRPHPTTSKQRRPLCMESGRHARSRS
ncbi:hypothetical protein PIB30_056730 [Stylosanthes scabra]|uniref:Uncharacterized protein n=1 Tax=Stylosanthes scabra TaxID=79078 RepID=A0ABU6YHM5_9FABA|nr:hypothetical protein [Stylosanthes scabra]